MQQPTLDPNLLLQFMIAQQQQQQEFFKLQQQTQTQMLQQQQEIAKNQADISLALLKAMQKKKSKDYHRGRSAHDRSTERQVLAETGSKSAVLAVLCQELAFWLTPQEHYKASHNNPYYNEAYWTFSLTKNLPQYAGREITPRIVEQHQLVLTTQLQQRVNIQDPTLTLKLSPEANYDYIYNLHRQESLKRQPKTESVRETITKDSSIKQAVDAIRLHQSSPLLANQEYGPNEQRATSITYHPDAAHKDIYERWNIETQIFFQGIIHIDDFHLSANVTQISVEEFINEIKQQTLKFLIADVTLNSRPLYPTLYSIKIFYSNNLGGDRTLKIWQGIPVDVEDINLTVIHEDFQQTLGEIHYEGKYSPGEFQLDLTRFRIERLDISRSGGNAEDLALIAEWLTQPNERVLQLSWAKVDFSKSVNNQCFMKALSDHLKTHNLPPKHKNYYDLAHHNLGLNQAQPTSVEQALKACNLLKIPLEIYDVNGEIIAPTSPQTSPQTLRVLLFENHYARILSLTSIPPIPQAKTNQDDSVDSRRKFYTPHTCYFDLETVTDKKGVATPYSISYAIDDSEPSFHCSKTPDFNLFFPMIEACRALGPGAKVTLMAYNGSNFDYNLLYRYILERDYPVVRAANPLGTGQQFTFKVPTNASSQWIQQRVEEEGGDLQYRLFLEKQYQLITVWDPALFLRTSLRTAAENFKLDLSKGEIGHEEVQLAYMQGELGKWLEKNEEKLREYNNQDVEVLRELVKKLLSALEQATLFLPQQIITLPSISNLAYKLFEKMTREDVNASLGKLKGQQRIEARKKFLKPQRVQLESTDKLIRQSVIAGRTEGEVGKHDLGKAVLVDVVSLYPSVMLRNKFPCGEEKIYRYSDFSDEDEIANFVGKLLHPRNPGCSMILVGWDQSKMTTPHPILPERGETLEWHKFGEGEGLLPDVTIRQLIEYGADIGIPAREEGEEDKIVAICWQGKACFTNYVEKLSALKNQQDEWKAKGASLYNPSIREMAKMLLNALSGKMIQRNAERQACLVKGKELGDFVRDLFNKEKDYETNMEDLDITIDVLTTKWAHVTWKSSGWNAASKPAQVGVFIYAYARAYMFEHVMSKMKVWYTDTDSALIESGHYPRIKEDLRCSRLFKSGRFEPKREKKFGDFEVEKVCDSAIVVAPKTYCLIRQGRVVKSGAKGVSPSDYFVAENGEEKMVGENELEFYELLNERRENCEKVKVLTKQFRRDWRNVEIRYYTVVKYI